jgi:hypothetical protein
MKDPENLSPGETIA